VIRLTAHKLRSLHKHLPSSCILCTDTTPFRQLLCQACEDDLPRLLHGCQRCGEPIAVQDEVCGQCLHSPPALDQVVVLFHYRDPLQHLIQKLKFRQSLAIATWAGNQIVQQIGIDSDELPGLIIPVPLHPKRTRFRGFNQSLEIAKTVARQLRLPIDTHRCRRQHHTQPQSELAREQRLSNLKDAFIIDKPIRQAHAVLIDDVMTTGSTLNELARCLKQQGVKRVDAWVVARATRT